MNLLRCFDLTFRVIFKNNNKENESYNNKETPDMYIKNLDLDSLIWPVYFISCIVISKTLILFVDIMKEKRKNQIILLLI